MFNKNFELLGYKFRLTPIRLIVLIGIVLRIPSLFEPYWYGDEAIYLAVGEGLRQGQLLYKDIFDHKTPLIYYLAQIAGSLFWFKFILLVWMSATILFFATFAKRILSLSKIPTSEQEKAVIIASTIFMLLTTLPLIEGNLVNAELLMTGPTIWAIYLLIDKNLKWKNIFMAGLLFSVSILFKVPAIFDFFALIAFLGISSLWKVKEIIKAIFSSFILTLGVLTPILISIFYFWTKGTLNDYLAAGLLINLSYITNWAAPTVSSTSTFEGNLIFRAEVLIGILILTIIFKKFFDKATLLTVIWFSFTLFALLLSGRPYPHYLIQIVAPLSLVIVLLKSNTEKYRFQTIPYLFIFLTSLVFYQFSYYPVYTYYRNFISFATGFTTTAEYIASFDSRMPRTYKLAQEIATKTTPKDHIFIWGTEPELYALSRRVPPGRYITSFHISDFTGKQETINSLVANPPKYIIKMRTEHRYLPGLDKLLSEKYLYIQTTGDADVWKLLPKGIIQSLKK